ncbi:GNAT family N-acetyltransferase [Haloimpatiens massiliensis]|uniref:GNAT family N-acetyltransferase n=1 Tax=Haloimpatiens massiliensis TaxID=1658110 RepID=UPI000C840072|nr:GNAT family protein [Haloimpatiens massiliensis]
MFKYIVDNDIELKLPNKQDAERFYKLIDNSREHLKRWLPWVIETKSVDDIMSFIEEAQRQYVSDEGFKAIIIFKGKFAGLIGYYNVDKSRGAVSIGYWLGQEYQGKGIMTKALKVFLDYGFKEMELNKIEITIAEENLKSRALPKKYGFTEEGIIRDAEWLNDRYVNHILYGLLKREWIGKKREA